MEKVRKESIEIRLARKAERLAENIRKLNPVIRYPVAAMFIIAGIIFGFVPVIPGWTVSIIGVMIFSRRMSMFLERKLEEYIIWKSRKSRKCATDHNDTHFDYVSTDTEDDNKGLEQNR